MKYFLAVASNGVFAPIALSLDARHHRTSRYIVDPYALCVVNHYRCDLNKNHRNNDDSSYLLSGSDVIMISSSKMTSTRTTETIVFEVDRISFLSLIRLSLYF